MDHKAEYTAAVMGITQALKFDGMGDHDHGAIERL
jgi:hypothetical protein